MGAIFKWADGQFLYYTVLLMFTGIVEATAKVLQSPPSGLTIERPSSFKDIKKGSSICVSGVCLSVISMTKTSLSFDVVPETREKSTLGLLKKGDRVNLERAMKVGERFDGHVVQGHVEGVGKVDPSAPRPNGSAGRALRARSGKRKEESDYFIVRCPAALVRFIVPKGSIAIDGVSLTVVSLKGRDVSIALIPHTLENTTLGSLKKGDSVNIETDFLVRSLHAL